MDSASASASSSSSSSSNNNNRRRTRRSHSDSNVWCSSSSSSSSESESEWVCRSGTVVVQEQWDAKTAAKRRSKVKKSGGATKGATTLRAEACSCAGGLVADCAAICCCCCCPCPCALLHLLLLALVKIPSSLARRLTHRSRTHSRPPAIPAKSGPQEEVQLDVVHEPTPASKEKEEVQLQVQVQVQVVLDNEGLWNALYEDGHLGFGGRHFLASSSQSSSGRRPSNFVHLLNAYASLISSHNHCTSSSSSSSSSFSPSSSAPPDDSAAAAASP